jgi:hypothetical protein
MLNRMSVLLASTLQLPPNDSGIILLEVNQMSIVLELRGHLSHAGTPLVHETSEDVVLSNVFGIVKNLNSAVLSSWVYSVMEVAQSASEWSVDFWQTQPKPIGIIEGSTIVDLVLESSTNLVFVEVKMDAPASLGTRHGPHRNQLARNLDIGYRRATAAGKGFGLVFVTPELKEPAIVESVRSSMGPFPTNPDVRPESILACLRWAPWASIGDAVAKAYSGGSLQGHEQKFALDLLAYMVRKGLWRNTLSDDEVFYLDKLYRPLRRDASPFAPYANRKSESYQGWRDKLWDEASLRQLLRDLRLEDRALLKMLADAGGAMRQDQLMRKLPLLTGRSSASLRALKSHVNAACKALDRAPILAEGTGSGAARIHEIDRRLGPLRSLVIEIGRQFDVDWRLLEPVDRTSSLTVEAATNTVDETLPPPPTRHATSENKAWFVLERNGCREIGAFVNAKGSCSYRQYSLEGHFLHIHRQRGAFTEVFAHVLSDAKRFYPPYQPDLQQSESTGLPSDVVASAAAVADPKS